MTARTIALFAAAFLVYCRPVAGSAGGGAPSWILGSSTGRDVADLSRVPAAPLQPGLPSVLSLPEPFRFRGALYDTIETGARPGELRLTHTGGGRHADEGGLLVRACGEDLVATPGSVVQWRAAEGLVALRHAGFVTSSGEPAAFDVLVEPGEPFGRLVLQWLQVPMSVRRDADAVLVVDVSRDDARAEPLAEGLALRPGTVVVFPGDVPWNPALPLTGCSIAPSWCEVVQANDPGCLQGPSFGGDYSRCTTTEAKWWHFREGQYCRNCPYTFYVTVECGTEMHLPFRDMEGNQISITNVFNGVEMELEALNDCAKSPFLYCDRCAVGGGVQPDPTGGICSTGGTRVDCIPYLQRSTLIQWGWPRTDRNGDTVADELPCGPPNTDTCSGARTGGWPAHEQINTDVILHGDPALCGVFRIDILSGGFDWYLSANCTGIVPATAGEAELNYRTYQNCSDALAAFDPVPELAITKLDFTGTCPDIELVVEVTNLGCVDSPGAPVRLDFERTNQPDLDLDLGVIPAGTSATIRVPVSLRAVPMNVTAIVDPLNVISECTEQAAGSFSGCAPVSGADTLTNTLCTCANTISPLLLDDSLVACNGASVAADATGSGATPCAGGTLEYRVQTAAGATVRDWSPDPITWLTPTRCPAIDSYVMQVRCSLETGPDCVRSLPFTVECAEAPSLTVTSDASPICQGELVSITATAGFGTYVWEDGRAGRSFVDRPAGPTTYRVTATTPSGCVAQGEVTVDVLPDPIPGPLGASLRVAKSGSDLHFTYSELPATVMDYRLIVHEVDGTPRPCAQREPPTKPAPITMDAAAVLDVALPGAVPPQLGHAGGVDACPKLLFYVVVATSPCTGTPGTSCNGWPLQRVPCP